MASVNENINFNVNFNESDIDKSANKLDEINSALRKIDQSAKALENFDLFGDVDLSKNVGVLKALKTHMNNIKEAINALKSDTSKVNFKDKIAELNTALQNTKKIMQDIAYSNIDKSVSSIKDMQTQDPTRGMSISESLSEVDKSLTSEQKQRYNNMVRELNVQRRINAEKQKEEQRQRALEASRSRTYNSLRSQLSSIESEADAVEEAYKGVFSSGDYSGLRDANERMVSLRNNANSLRQSIAAASSQGINTSQLEASLSSIEERIRRISRETSQSLRRNLLSSMSGAITRLNTLMNSFMQTAYRTAVTLTRNWARLLSKTFSSVISGWKKALSALFSSGSGGKANAITSQLKSLMGYASIAGLIALGKQAVELSSDMFEVQNVINNVFKESSEDINDFCDNAAAKFNLTSLEAKKMTGVFGGMLSASNLTGEAQREMSKNLTALTGDLASFYNMSTSDVYAKLQSGLQGNVSAMRSFGVSMTVANLEAYALSQGITTSYKDMDQATKTTLRYNYMLRQLSVAQGDFARTAGSWSNQVRTLSGNFKQLLSIIGGGIIKALYPALIVLNQIISAAVTAANALAKLFGFGAIDLGNMFGGGGEVSMPELDDYSSGLEDVADATGDVADATAKANENLQTFDKLNNVQSPSGGSGGGGGAGGAGGVGGIGSMLDFESYYDKIGDPEQAINKRVEAILNTLKDFAKDVASVDYSGFIRSWKNMSKALDPIVSDIGDGIIWLWKKVLFPFYKWGIEAGAPAVFDVIAEALKALHEIIRAVSPEIDRFWDSTLAPFFSNKGDAFVSLMKKWKISIREWTNGLKESDDKLKYLGDTISTLKEKLYNWIDDEEITSRLDSIGENLRSIFSNLISKDTLEQAKSLLRTFTKLNLIVFDNILKVIEYLTGNTKVTSFVEFLVEQFGDLADFTFDAIIELVDYIAGSDEAREIITNIKEAIKNIIAWVVDNKDTILSLLEKASELILWMSEHITEILIAFGAIKGIGLFTSLISGLATFSKSWGALFGSRGSAVSSATETAASVTSVFTRAFDKIKTAGSGMWSTITNSKLGGIALPAAGIAGVVAGTAYAGSESYEYWTTRQEAVDAFNESIKKSPEYLQKFIDQENLLLEGKQGNIDYGLSLQGIVDTYESMDENVKSLVVSANKLNNTFEYATPKEVQDSLKNFEKSLRDAGFANDDLLGKIAELNSIDLTEAGSAASDYKDQMILIMRDIIMEVNGEMGVLSNLTDEELDEILNAFGETGEEAPKAYYDKFTDNIVYIDQATGMLYNRMDNTYTEITNKSELAGKESIIGYVDGVGEEKQYLITETGKVIDTVIGSVSVLPKEWRSYAKSTIDNTALEFNKDGSINTATMNLIRNVSTNALSAATEGANSTSNAFIKTYSGNINSDSSINRAVTGKINESTASAAGVSNSGGANVANQFTIGAADRFNRDTEISGSMRGSVVRGYDGVDEEVYNRGDSTGYNIITGITNGIWNNVSGLWDTLTDVGSRMLSTLGNVLKIHSPSRAFADLTKFVPMGIAKGILDNEGYAYSSVSELANGMLSSMESVDMDMSSIIDANKFSSKYNDILYETDVFTRDMKSKYGNLSALDMQSNMIISPSVKRAELAANVAQSSTTSRLSEGVSALYNRVNQQAGGSNTLVCNLIMDGNKMASFVIDTINGRVVQTGNF